MNNSSLRNPRLDIFPLPLYGAMFVGTCLLTFYLGAFGFFGALVTCAGILGLWIETEDLRRQKHEAKLMREKEREEVQRFSKTLTATLEGISAEEKTTAAYEALKLQCETAAELSERWGKIVEGDIDLRTEEADFVVTFEQTFEHYAARLATMNLADEAIHEELESGSKSLLDFHKYLVLLAVKAEMG